MSPYSFPGWPRPSAEEVLSDVCRQHDTTLEVITGPSQKAPAVAARYDAIRRLFTLSGLSHKKISEIIHRDRTVVLRALK